MKFLWQAVLASVLLPIVVSGPPRIAARVGCFLGCHISGRGENDD
jgi:hypothetical protein